MIGIINNSLLNVTPDQCICQMVKSNELISAVNYFQTNKTCQLFSYNITSVLITFNADSTLIFINRTSISITSIQSDMPLMESTSSSSSTTTRPTTTTARPRCNTTFSAQTTYSTGSGSEPAPVFVADVNNDNKPDIIVGNFGKNNVGIFFNSGNGTFLSQTTYPTGSDPNSVSVADVNNDNKPDIIVANIGNDNVGVFLAC